MTPTHRARMRVFRTLRVGWSDAESYTGSSLTSYAGCYRSNHYTLSDFP
jgi:hypothetical protein